MAEKSRGGEGRRRGRRIRRWLWGLLVIPLVIAGGAGLLAFYLVFSSVPLPDDIAARSSVVLDLDGAEVGGLASDVTREDVPLATLPAHVGEAVLAAEDRGFADHHGVSFTGIARALFTNVRAGSVQQGGSTITQQYIKNAELTPDQTYTRKVEEAALALKMEREFTKDEILEFYLNTIYWGRGTYGIEAAARTYFDATAGELDVNQAALLAGIIAAPEAFDPLENPERAEERRRYTLNGMLEIDALTQAEHDELVELGLPEVTQRRGLDRGPNAYYLDQVRRELGQRPEFAQGELFRGLVIHTELDQRMQEAAQRHLTTAVEDGPTDSGAIVTIDPADGGVRALVGGPGIDTQPLNTAVRSVRQVGSTFKPFTLHAFVQAGHSPESRFPAPDEIEIDDAATAIRNFGGVSFGEQSVRQATASSTNTVYVQMQEEVGREAVIDAARGAGMPRSKNDEVFATDRGDGDTMRPLAGLTLGQDGFSPVEVAAGYATYAAEGVSSRPRVVSRVEDADGNVVYEPPRHSEQTTPLEVSRHVTDVLVDVVTEGSGTAAALEDRPVAGKTGTTSEGRDVWFAGYVPQLSTSVWLGNLDNTPIEAENATGGGLAAPLWGAYMAEAVEGLEPASFVAPGDDLEALGEADEACPDGYRFADPPSSADEDGFFPDVLVDITDDEGRPCVEVKPELEPCPDGYEFADPPSGPDEFGRVPDVLDEPVDFRGRPCVEVLGEPEPDEDDTADDADEPDDEPTDDGDGDGGDDGDAPPADDDGGGEDGGGDNDDGDDGGGATAGTDAGDDGGQGP